jgi:hypothetical protein
MRRLPHYVNIGHNSEDALTGGQFLNFHAYDFHLRSKNKWCPSHPVRCNPQWSCPLFCEEYMSRQILQAGITTFGKPNSTQDLFDVIAQGAN